MRQEFGFTRTVCACAECTNNCKFISGYLIPVDLYRIAQARGFAEPDIFEFAKRELLASPGARAIKDDRIITIRTIVPARRADGSCIYLDSEGRCTIHAVSPFGCAFFDAHQPRALSDFISMRGLEAIVKDEQRNGLYARVWAFLDRHGKRALSPIEGRLRMQKAMQGREVMP